MSDSPHYDAYRKKACQWCASGSLPYLWNDRVWRHTIAEKGVVTRHDCTVLPLLAWGEQMAAEVEALTLQVQALLGNEVRAAEAEHADRAEAKLPK